MRPHFVRIGQRWQHLWLAGSGAPLLLLHGSPDRGLALKPLIESLARDYLVIAPDLPGNGYSDPLPATANTARDHALATQALMETLRIEEFGIYGVNSGAVIAAELAIAAPVRVAGVVLDGYPVWTGDEAAKLGDAFLPAFAPLASGAHLAELWSRLIDEQLFFPWHVHQADHAIRAELSDSEPVHERAMGFLDAGADYDTSYRLALSDDGAARIAALAETRISTLVMAEADSLFDQHRQRLDAHPTITTTQAQGSDSRARQLRAFFDLCNMNTASEGVYLPESERRYVQPSPGAVGTDTWLFVETPRNGSTVWLHDVGESQRRGPGSNVRLDLPGHGYSTMPWPGSRTAATAIVAETLETLGLRPADCTGRGLGRQIAETFTGTTPTPPRVNVMPDLTPSWEGAHLLRAWHYCRYRSQYADWRERSSNARRAADMPNPQMLQQQTIDLLRAGARTLNAITAENLQHANG